MYNFFIILKFSINIPQPLTKFEENKFQNIMQINNSIKVESIISFFPENLLIIKLKTPHCKRGNKI